MRKFASRNVPFLIITGILFCFVLACGEVQRVYYQANAPQGLSWYRGNTHTHTNRSSGTSETPDRVAAWYLTRGYHFVCLTDHNVLTAPSTVTLPLGARKNFILIPSEEIHPDIPHATALNIQRAVPPPPIGTMAEMIQQCLEETEKASGILIVNHPNYLWSLNTSDIRAVGKLKLFELYNCHPNVQNEGDTTHASTEAMWDALLTDGMKIFAVASDDSHDYPTTYSPTISGPGKGWVMIQALELTPSAVADALANGRFYATIGVLLSKVELDPLRMSIEIDRSATESELALGTAFGRPAQSGAKIGERIDFIGTGGKLLASVEGFSASFSPSEKGYVRGRASVTRLIDGHLVEFCAWTQPVFIN